MNQELINKISREKNKIEKNKISRLIKRVFLDLNSENKVLVLTNKTNSHITIDLDNRRKKYLKL